MTVKHKLVTVSRDAGITIETEGGKVDLSFEEFREIEAAVNREVYYRDDVELAYSELRSRNIFPADFDSKGYINAVLSV